MTVDLTGWNNEDASITLEIPEVYRNADDLDLCSWQAMTRREASDEDVVDLASTANGRVSYASGALTIFYPLASVETMSGAYTWDLRYITPEGKIVRIDGGTRIVKKGTSR